MSFPVCSLLHATKGRPEKAVATMRLWASRATDPSRVEYVIAMERDDYETNDLLEFVLATDEMPWCENTVVGVRGGFGGSAPAWDAAYRVSNGHLLVQVSDDFEPPKDWDTALLNRLPEGWEINPVVLAVGDSHRKDRLLTMLIASRAFCDAEGCFLFKGYKSVWSDGDATYRAYKRGCVIEARDLVFEHKHPFFDKSVPMDATYAAQNEPLRYAEGEKLFTERFPEWRASGIVDWI